jgi:hypothetical protein
MEVAKRARDEFCCFRQQAFATARKREGEGARPRLVREAIGQARAAVDADARGQDRRPADHLAHTRKRLAGVLVLAEAVAPHAAARQALERCVVDIAERERHIEPHLEDALAPCRRIAAIEIEAARTRHQPVQILFLRPVRSRAEQHAIDLAIRPPQNRGQTPFSHRRNAVRSIGKRGLTPVACRDGDELREVGSRHLREGLDDPAGLSGRVREDADAQLRAPRTRRGDEADVGVGTGGRR